MRLNENFTSPAQGKRLLELGVPAWTADCYYMAIGLDAEKYGYSDFPYFMTTNYVDREHVIAGINIPCWSVGRLIEIAFICSDYELRLIEFWRNDSPMYDILDEFEYNKMDFQKLEE